MSCRVAFSNSHPMMPGGVNPHPIFQHPDLGRLVTSYCYPEQDQQAKAGWLAVFADVPEELSLECRLMEIITRPIHIDAHCSENFLSPNEEGTYQLSNHLINMKPGIVVSTGANRRVFTFLHAPEDRRRGLVGRDINPKIKAYNDFFTLLLKISTSLNDYNGLFPRSSRPAEVSSKLDNIRKRIHASLMPKQMRCYYLKHLNDFAEIYFGRRHFPETGYDAKIGYDTHPAIFKKLQNLAQQGNMVSTIGDIGDLNFLLEREISVIDTSNIHDSTLLDFKGSDLFKPLIVWTDLRPRLIRYNSYIHEPLTVAEREEYNGYLMRLTNNHHVSPKMLMRVLGSFLRAFLTQTRADGSSMYAYDRTGCSYDRNTLNMLRGEYINTYLQSEHHKLMLGKVMSEVKYQSGSRK